MSVFAFADALFMSFSKHRFDLAAKWIFFSGAILIFLASCRQETKKFPSVNSEMPAKILWAWERAEDLRFVDAKKFGVAFLAQTLFLEKNDVIFRPRRQPLQVAPNTYLIAVTRIESNKKISDQTNLSDEQKKKVVSFIRKTLELPSVKAVQIDFDATVSERDFYRGLIFDLKKQLPENTPLTITALASWCAGDAWFDDFPVDEAVPMIFEMGADDDFVRRFLESGNDWREPLCRGSYGIAVDSPLKINFNSNRRFFYFKSTAWTKSDLEKLD